MADTESTFSSTNYANLLTVANSINEFVLTSRPGEVDAAAAYTLNQYEVILRGLSERVGARMSTDDKKLLMTLCGELLGLSSQHYMKNRHLTLEITRWFMMLVPDAYPPDVSTLDDLESLGWPTQEELEEAEKALLRSVMNMDTEDSTRRVSQKSVCKEASYRNHLKRNIENIRMAGGGKQAGGKQAYFAQNHSNPSENDDEEEEDEPVRAYSPPRKRPLISSSAGGYGRGKAVHGLSYGRPAPASSRAHGMFVATCWRKRWVEWWNDFATNNGQRTLSTENLKTYFGGENPETADIDKAYAADWVIFERFIGTLGAFVTNSSATVHKSKLRDLKSIKFGVVKNI